MNKTRKHGVVFQPPINHPYVAFLWSNSIISGPLNCHQETLLSCFSFLFFHCLMRLEFTQDGCRGSMVIRLADMDEWDNDSGKLTHWDGITICTVKKHIYAQICIYAMHITNIQIKNYPKLVTQIQTNISCSPSDVQTLRISSWFYLSVRP